MLRAFTLISLAFLTAAGLFGDPVKKAKPVPAAGAKTAHSAANANRKSAKTASAHTTTSAHSRSAAGYSTARTVRYVRNRNGKLVRVVSRSAPGPSYQLHPDPERYQQIQQALADKGYFKGEVNGVWGDDSEDALRRFQMDQKMDDADGHLTALTLIGLGLGPKHDHDLSTAPTPAPLPAAPAPSISLPASAPATTPATATQPGTNSAAAPPTGGARN